MENGEVFCVGGVGLKGGLELEVMAPSFVSCSAPTLPLYAHMDAHEALGSRFSFTRAFLLHF